MPHAFVTSVMQTPRRLTLPVWWALPESLSSRFFAGRCLKGQSPTKKRKERQGKKKAFQNLPCIFRVLSCCTPVALEHGRFWRSIFNCHVRWPEDIVFLWRESAICKGGISCLVKQLTATITTIYNILSSKWIVGGSLLAIKLILGASHWNPCSWDTLNHHP